MDFLAALIAYAGTQGISPQETQILHDTYCQNLYFQPEALAKMQDVGCDIESTAAEIYRVKSGIY